MPSASRAGRISSTISGIFCQARRLVKAISGAPASTSSPNSCWTADLQHLLLRQVGRVEVDRQAAIARGIPCLVVGAVENAAHWAALMSAQQIVQAAAVFGRLDLGGVGRADRHDPIGRQNAALQERDLVAGVSPAAVDPAPHRAPAGAASRLPRRCPGAPDCESPAPSAGADPAADATWLAAAPFASR